MGRSIQVITTAPELAEKGLFGDGIATVKRAVDLDTLKVSVKNLTADLADVFSSVEMSAGYHLNEVEVGVEVSSEGGLVLIGTAKVGGKAALTLKFGRA